MELGAEALLKGTRVDGVYDKDPLRNTDAVKFDELTFEKAIADRRKVMDTTAFALCEQGPVPIVVFNINDPDALLDILRGGKTGTLVHA